MRWAAVLLAVAVLGGCGDDERPAATSDPDQPVSSGEVPPDRSATPAGSKRVCTRLGRRLAGDPIAAATARAERRGCPLRVAVLDGEPQALTEDFSPARINVRVRGGVVTGVAFMG